MSGNVRGKIECYISNKDHNYNMQNVFKNLYDFFTSHPNFALISLNYGNTNGPAASGAGTGAGYVGQDNTNIVPAAATFGNNAWFVVRQNATLARPYDVFHLFQWTGANNGTRGQSFGTGPAGSPGLVNGSTQPINANYGAVAHACAIGVSGSGGQIIGNIYGASTSGSLGSGFGNPWRGTMNAYTGALGTDTKPATGPVWSAPVASGTYAAGTGVMIFPRSNDGDTGAFRGASSVGHFAENMGGMYAGNNNVNSDVRMHVIADDDSFVFWVDTNDSNNASTIMCFSGIYVPRAGLNSGAQGGITPYAVIDSYNALPWSVANESVYGDIAGTSAQQGGIIGNTTGSVRPLVMDQSVAFMIDFNFHPNQTMSSSTGPAPTGFYDEYDIPVGIYEPTPVQISGFLGHIDFVRSMYNVSTPGVRWDFNRSFVGSLTVADRKYSIPWDSQNRTVPRTGTTRQGITFVRPGPA
jgi:hypothetical protein